jgi:hypothetical protein
MRESRLSGSNERGEETERCRMVQATAPLLDSTVNCVSSGQNATQGMMNLTQPSTQKLGTAFPGMASLLNALTNMKDAASSVDSTAKDDNARAFYGRRRFSGLAFAFAEILKKPQEIAVRILYDELAVTQFHVVRAVPFCFQRQEDRRPSLLDTSV